MRRYTRLTGGWNGRPSVQEEMDSTQSQRVARRLFHQLIFIQQIRKLFHFIRKKMINEFWDDYRWKLERVCEMRSKKF